MFSKHFFPNMGKPHFFAILYIFIKWLKCPLHNDISASYLIILPTWWGVLTEKQLNKSSWHVALLLYWFLSDAVTHHWVKKNPNKEQYTPTSVKYCDTNWNKSWNWKLTSIMRTFILAIANTKEKKNPKDFSQNTIVIIWICISWIFKLFIISIIFMGSLYIFPIPYVLIDYLLP